MNESVYSLCDCFFIFLICICLNLYLLDRKVTNRTNCSQATWINNYNNVRWSKNPNSISVLRDDSFTLCVCAFGPCQSKVSFNRWWSGSAEVFIQSSSDPSWVSQLSFSFFLTKPHVGHNISLNEITGSKHRTVSRAERLLVDLVWTFWTSEAAQHSLTQSHGTHNEVHTDTVSPCIFCWSETIPLFTFLYPVASHDTR